ncbi:MAG: hypothetical protein AAF694_15515 [Bacteroidota bacterium]
MKYVARILLFAGIISTCIEGFTQNDPFDLEGSFSSEMGPHLLFDKRWVPTDWGMKVGDFPANDLADSLARMELRGYIFPIEVAFSFEGERKGSDILTIQPELINSGRYDYVWVKFSFPYEKQFPGEFQLYVKGVTIDRDFSSERNRHLNLWERTPILVDSSFEHSTANSLAIKVPFHKLHKELVGGDFVIQFHELYRVDSKGRRFPRDSEYLRNISTWNSIPFKMFFADSDTLSGGRYGFPRIVLLVDGEVYHEGDLIGTNSTLELSLLPSPTFVKEYPNEQMYQIRGVKVIEFGETLTGDRKSWDRSSSWSSIPKIPLSLEDFSPSHTGIYLLQIESVLRKDRSGKVHIQKKYGEWEPLEIRIPHSRSY